MKQNSHIKFLLYLFLILFFTASFCACGREKSGETEAVISAKPEANGEILAFTKDEIKKFGEGSSNAWELYQRFFTDVIIYKDRMGQYVYKDVDRSMPLSYYNFDNLVEKGLTGREIEYIEDGELKSIKGIDVSGYQEDINWKNVAEDGVRFAILRLGYRGYSTGKIVMDEKFIDYITEALANDIGVGIYFVTQAVNTEEALEEAEFVLDAIKPYRVNWPIVLDLEDAASAAARSAHLSSGERTEIIKAFCDTVKAAGYTPMLYANIRWYMDEMDLKELTEYDKWFAQYFNHPFFPYEYTMWQYTDKGKVKGINGSVDMDICFKDYGSAE